ncbi:MAG: glutathione S-transferase [Alphaproteobacteria bacterium]|nr:glutathione S-transferase [Alphaproteobacteria bacterium]HCP00281.1 glutathione S-transferase [Rhodospirillaceae bacterium]|tara:strand:+ start:233 stop:835 length:603 start_codon:yes stop_codon:yes gene_type:complete
MKLIYSTASPYARKARVAAIECGANAGLELEAILPWEDPAGFRDVNPVGKVPALVRDDGPPLYQSNIICEYLDAQGKIRIYPDPGPARWTALRQVAAADGIIDASVAERMEGMFHDDNAASKIFIDRQEHSVHMSLDQLESEASGLDGPVTIGQVAVSCALAYRDFRFADIDWRTARPALAAWFATFAQRPSMIETAPQA